MSTFTFAEDVRALTGMSIGAAVSSRAARRANALADAPAVAPAVAPVVAPAETAVVVAPVVAPAETAVVAANAGAAKAARTDPPRALVKGKGRDRHDAVAMCVSKKVVVVKVYEDRRTGEQTEVSKQVDVRTRSLGVRPDRMV